MKAIKATLTERWYAWDNARHEAMDDQEINMYADLDAGEAAYLPKDQVEPEDSLERREDSQESLARPREADVWAPGKEART